MDQRVDVGHIQWREWNEETFTDARQQEKPILLTLTATWCHWCHVMDQTAYSHPQVIGLVNSQFIPVRVDVDQRPDISRRYNQGGFPSVAILNGEGELITGRVYTPAAEMVRLLEQVSSSYPETATQGLEPENHPAGGSALLSGRDVQESPASQVFRRLQELYDPDFGGFGREPKQPPWEGLRFLLALYSRAGDRGVLEMVVKSLEGMRIGLYDHKDQGFFRYSVARDWKVPHYEKMLVTNANLASLYLEAYQVTGKTVYKNSSVGALDYLLATLYDNTRGAFYASQDAGEEYYRLPWKDREREPKPSIDLTFYSGWNALAAASLIRASGVVGSASYLQVATRVLDLLWNETWSAEQGLAHVVGGGRQQPPVLEDHLYFLRAMLILHQATGHQEHLRRAVAVVGWIRTSFGAPDGGFYDISQASTSSDLVLARDKPVLENSLLAEGLVTLSYLTGEEEYLTLARRTLETFEGTVPGSSYLGPKNSRRMEEDEELLFLPAGSAWGRAWDMLVSGPVHLVLIGSASDRQTRSLLSAALKTYAPHQIIQLLDPEKDGDRIADLGFPARSGPALYACMGGMCMAPITTPKGVRELRASRPWAVR